MDTGDTGKRSLNDQAWIVAHPYRRRFQADHVYALATVYFMCATIGVFAIARFISKLTDSTTKSKSFLGRWMSIPRYAEYKTFKVLGRVTPALGILLLIAAGSVYFIGE
jgi:hypothetical protein